MNNFRINGNDTCTELLLENRGTVIVNLPDAKGRLDVYLFIVNVFVYIVNFTGYQFKVVGMSLCTVLIYCMRKGGMCLFVVNLLDVLSV